MAGLAEASIYRNISVSPINPAIGAEIADVDLSRELDAATAAEIMAAILDHLVVFFPGQDIAPDRQAAFARHFGDVPEVPDSMFRVHADNPYVSVLENDAERPPTVNNWHSDYSFAPRPDFLSILHARSIPDVGGDTIWVNMYAAYEALTDPMKTHLDGRLATHDFMKFYERPFKRHLWEGARFDYMEAARRDHPPVRHPVVRTIPETGRRGAVHQRVLHPQHRGSGRTRKRQPARLPVRPHPHTGIPDPVSMGARHPGRLGQPGYGPLRRRRLSPAAPADAPGDGAQPRGAPGMKIAP